jgi:hypothetical protein
VRITNSAGQLWTPPGFSGISLGGGGLAGGASYGSVVNGKTLPGAWDVEIDIFSYDFAASVGGGSITIWGVSLPEIWQASNLNNFNVEIYGGMAPGLPLATTQAQYAGLLAKGQIYPAFGNWVGTEQTLCLTVIPGQTTSGKPLFGASAAPANISWNWLKGQSMSQAITNTLQAAFPGVTVNVNINSNLVLTNQNQDAQLFASLTQFAQCIGARSIATLNQTGYTGVRIGYDAARNALNVFDGSQSGGMAKLLNFADFIGQPTWLGTSVNFKTPMRADLKIGSVITMPQGLNPINTAQSSILQSTSKLSFQGNYQVQRVRHVGRYRETSGDAWCTVFDAAIMPAAAGA